MRVRLITEVVFLVMCGMCFVPAAMAVEKPSTPSAEPAFDPRANVTYDCFSANGEIQFDNTRSDRSAVFVVTYEPPDAAPSFEHTVPAGEVSYDFIDDEFSDITIIVSVRVENSDVVELTRETVNCPALPTATLDRVNCQTMSVTATLDNTEIAHPTRFGVMAGYYFQYEQDEGITFFRTITVGAGDTEALEVPVQTNVPSFEVRVVELDVWAESDEYRGLLAEDGFAGDCPVPADTSTSQDPVQPPRATLAATGAAGNALPLISVAVLACGCALIAFTRPGRRSHRPNG